MTSKASWARRTWIAAALLVVGLLLIGCAYSSVKLEWVETQREGYWSATYDSFDGIKATMCLLQEDQIINLNYDLDVTQGALSVAVIQPDGNWLWSKTFEEPTAGSIALVPQMAGRHRFRVEGEATSGGFALSWDLDGGDE